jgi:hypothetical protein
MGEFETLIGLECLVVIGYFNDVFRLDKWLSEVLAFLVFPVFCRMSPAGQWMNSLRMMTVRNWKEGRRGREFGGSSARGPISKFGAPEL